MNIKTASMLIDWGFVAAGLGTAAWLLARRWRPPSPASEPGEPIGLVEFVVTGVAVAAAAIGPNILVVALTPGQPAMHVLAREVMIPSIIALVLALGVAVALGKTRVAQRILVGLLIGAAASGALDAIRLIGFHYKQMPGNMPRMFGALLFDRMALGPSTTSDLFGSLYHYWVGACFGLTYTLLVGAGRWWGGVIWGLLIEIGMMTTAPMVVAMDTGYFGSRFGPGLFVTSLLAHLAFGALLGLLAQRYVTHPGSLPGLLWRRLRPPPHAEPSGS